MRTNQKQPACSERTDLPSSILALGTVDFNGKLKDRSNQTQISDLDAQIDNKLLLKKVLINDSELWCRVPQIAMISIIDQLPVIQIDDRQTAGSFNLFDIFDTEHNTRKCINIRQSKATCYNLDNLSTKNFLKELEHNLEKRNWSYNKNLINQVSYQAEFHPRFQFAKAVYHYLNNNIAQAELNLIQAQQLGHIDTIEALKICSQIRESQTTAKYSWYQPDACYKDFTSIRTKICKNDLAVLSKIASKYAIAIKDYSTSLEILDYALQRIVLDQELLLLRWHSLTQLEKDLEALTCAKLALQLFPANIQHYLNAFDSCIMLGRTCEARFYLSGALCQQGSNDDKLERLFLYYESQKNWALLEELAIKLVPLGTKLNIASHRYLAEILIETNELDKALLYLEHLLAQQPEHLPTLLAYGRALARSGQNSEALKIVSSLVQQGPDKFDSPDWRLLVTLNSELLRSLGKSEQALSVWEGTIPTAACELLEFAACQAENQYFHEALQNLQVVRLIEPRNPHLSKIEQQVKQLAGPKTVHSLNTLKPVD